MTDFRALCVELTDCLEKADWPNRYKQVFQFWVDIARAALAEEPAEPIPPAALPEGYIDPEHSGDDRALLQTFYSACLAEGGTADEITLRGLRAALADGPAVPEGREPASVTGQPSDEELLETLDKATATFPPRHPEAEGLNVVEYALALELRKARAVLARWGTSNLAETRSSLGGMPTPAPADKGEVAELVDQARYLVRELRDQADDLNPCLELFGLMHQAAVNLARIADLLQRLSPPQPVPVSERLPGPEDCDAEGRCWWWQPSHPESGYSEGWMRRPRAWGVGHYDVDDRLTHTHWLPAHALPLPGQEVEG